MLPELSDRHRTRLAPVKKVGLYLAGVLLLINGIGLFAVYTYVGGTLMLAAGAFVFPQTRAAIERYGGVTLTRLTSLGIFALLYLVGAVFVLSAVDLSQAPDILVPFQ